MRRTWSQDRVFFLDEDGCQYSLPAGWTDAVDPDVFVTAAAGRCPFRFEDLSALAGLLDGLRGSEGSTGGEFSRSVQHLVVVVVGTVVRRGLALVFSSRGFCGAGC